MAATFTLPCSMGPRAAPPPVPSSRENHLLITFNYYAKTLDATLADGKLTGSFGTISTRYPVSLSLHDTDSHGEGPLAQDIHGDWEIAVKSVKGESALATAR